MHMPRAKPAQVTRGERGKREGRPCRVRFARSLVRFARAWPNAHPLRAGGGLAAGLRSVSMGSGPAPVEASRPAGSSRALARDPGVHPFGGSMASSTLTNVHGRAATLAAGAVDALAARLRGTVVRPGDADFDS